ncbi:MULTISPECIES: hypothetical protein [unclassified Leptolyngbya]|uniref:hypothetical protein n=1 Tax=unclassified Leptolyngbya TaxID=2650499 RepID=UPI001688B3D5|nr:MULTISPECIES: hypothetical protein [unclassified Leptolyngbya]MBD1911427.1 hypothetical protein [Leptolyngbya sp. FACHB-8]MBD2159053.1 hypothetical protein [Leptolyngbya sp. FACHB-16]
MSSTQDNTLNTARNLGTLSGLRSLQDSLTSLDRVNYVKFQLGTRSRLTFSLNQLQQSTNLKLLNRSGTLITQFNQPPAGQGQAITRTLNTGLYYIRVGRISGNTSYTLKLNALVVQPEPGNTPSSARNLGILPGSLTLRESVGGTDAADYYRFQGSALSNVGVNISSPSGSLSTYLYRDINNNRAIDNNELVTSRYGSSISFSNLLPTGFYFLRVEGSYYSSAGYTLNLSSINYPGYTLSLDPGNQANTARLLGSLPANAVFKDYVGALDDVDYYQFQVDEVTQFNAITESLDGSTWTRLYKDLNNNRVIDSNENVANGSAGTSSSFSALLTPGSYYISVQQYLSSSTRYSLTLNSTTYPGYVSTPDPGNQAYLAQNLNALSTTTTLQNYVGDLDDIDYYRFQVDSVSSFSAVFNGLEGRINTALYKDINNNSVIDSGESVVSKSGVTESFSEWLTPGVYYLSVKRYIYDSTRYDLTLNATAYPDYTTSSDPGSQANTGRDLGLLSQSITLKDYVGKFDEVDYYRFQVDSNRSFTATLIGLDDSATVTLYRDTNNNAVIDYGEQLIARTGTSVSLVQALTPGVYYISVGGSAYDSTRYQLDLVV